jgi:hypothetical protein
VPVVKQELITLPEHLSSPLDFIYADSGCPFGIYKLFINQDEIEDTKRAIRIRISKKNRQYNDQKKKYKRTNNDL